MHIPDISGISLKFVALERMLFRALPDAWMATR
jgi:hypothetical protein